VGVQRHHPRRGHEDRHDPGEVGFAQGADVAHRLADDHVGAEVRHPLDIDFDRRHARAPRHGHGTVDLGGGERWIDGGVRHPRQRPNLRGVVARVRYSDEEVACSQRGDDLGGGRQERDDAH